ncbi:SDR family oxidoreductase [Brevibacterium sp. SIMBA_078]|uniref:SDR family NAD(P)-dependent oxidoreductase n=1 Tax=Brevibacterium sp. SIMBA_078 TaxID=3085816 RepID=UPI003978496A
MTDMRTVIVTGGTFGLGREMSLGLAQKGHRVVAAGIDSKQVSSTADGSVSAFRREVEDSGLRTIEVVETDVSDADQVDELARDAITRYDRVDALVNNAAIGPLGTVLDTEEALFEQVLAVNLKGPFLTSKSFIPHFAERGGGSIINVGSGAGWGKPNMSAYGASKGGLATLTTSMAYDFFHDRIRVNLLIPGGGGIAGGISFGRVGEGGSLVAATGSVAGRPVNGYDMAETVDFLIGESGTTISGSVIDLGCFANQGGRIQEKGNE